MGRRSSRGGKRMGRTMRKYTYIDKRNGKRVYSDKPLNKPYLEKATEVRGSVPQGMEKSGVTKSTDRDIALDGPEV